MLPHLRLQGRLRGVLWAERIRDVKCVIASSTPQYRRCHTSKEQHTMMKSSGVPTVLGQCGTWGIVSSSLYVVVSVCVHSWTESLYPKVAKDHSITLSVLAYKRLLVKSVTGQFAGTKSPTLQWVDLPTTKLNRQIHICGSLCHLFSELTILVSNSAVDELTRRQVGFSYQRVGTWVAWHVGKKSMKLKTVSQIFPTMDHWFLS